MRVIVSTVVFAAALIGLSCGGSSRETGAGGSTSSHTSDGGSTTTSSSPACTPSTASACEDDNPCTIDACTEEGTCAHAVVTSGTRCGDEPSFCTEAGECVVQGNQVGSLFNGPVGLIAVTAGGDFVVMTADSGPPALDTIQVARVNGQTGTIVWKRTFEASQYVGARTLTVDPAGNTYIAGPFDGTIDFGGGVLDSGQVDTEFVVKLDPEGAHLYSRAIPHVTIWGSGADASGDLAIAGSFMHSFDLGGGTVMGKDYSEDVLVGKLDPGGQQIFAKGVGGAFDACTLNDVFTCDQVATSMALDPSGNIVLAGYFAGKVDFGAGPMFSVGNMDMFLAKLDPSGQALWSRRFGDLGLHYAAPFIAVAPSGDIVMVGEYGGVLDFGGGPLDLGQDGQDRIFGARFDASGQHIWSKVLGSLQYLAGYGPRPALDPSGALVLSGNFAGTLDFGVGQTTTGTDTYTLFLAKFSPSGNLAWVQTGVGGEVAFDAHGNLAVGTESGIVLLAP